MKPWSARRAALGVGFLVVTGCSPIPGPTPIPSVTSPTASAASPTATPPAGVTAVDFHCRLPVQLNATNSGSGWIAFPSGQISTDPAASAGAGSYNWRFNRWVPVSWNAQSPDGSSYAYVGSDRLVHLVDMGTGSDAGLPGTQNMFILGFEPDGIYTRLLSGSELWRINPTTGKAVQVLNQGLWLTVGHGAAWGYDVAVLAVHALVRVDLTDASTQIWADPHIGPVLKVFGTDSQGRPVVEVGSFNGGSSRIDLMLGPDEEDVLYRSTELSGSVTFSNDLAAPTDRHGVWLAGNDGIYLVTPVSMPMMVKVSAASAFSAGACN